MEDISVGFSALVEQLSPQSGKFERRPPQRNKTAVCFS
jgi:hypothetical protein